MEGSGGRSCFLHQSVHVLQSPNGGWLISLWSAAEIFGMFHQEGCVVLCCNFAGLEGFLYELVCLFCICKLLAL